MPTLRPYQAEALDFLTSGGRTIYGDPPGTGKTATLLTYAESRPGRALLVVPANVLHHWVREAAHWVPDYPVAMYRGSDSAAKRRQAVESWLSAGGALVTNYEAMRRDVDWLTKAKISTFGLDEAHRIKGRTTQVNAAARKLAGRAEAFVGATGTPVMNRAEELWSLLNLVKPRVYTSYWRWVEEHFYVQSTTWNGKVKRPVQLVGKMRPGHDELIRRELLGILITRPLKELQPELGDEPIVTELVIDLLPAERRAYDKMAEYGWIEDEVGGFISADAALARRTRLRQLMADWGMLLPEKGLGSKGKAVVALAEDLAQPTLIFTRFKESARRIAEALGDTAAVYTGDQTPAEREDALARFRAGAAHVMVGTIDALGTGVDGLQYAAHSMIFQDLSDVYDINRQAIGRLFRMGQAMPVSVWTVSAKDTVDQAVAASLAHQQDVKERLTGEPWQKLVRGEP